MPGELIAPARGTADVAAARALIAEYAAGLGVSLCFQDFDTELATLPGAYAPPRGELWLARRGGTADPADAVGCVALRPLGHGGEDDTTAELKRLYVAPSARGGGLGRRLALEALRHARERGYRTVKLDTLADMRDARALYASLGFAPCAAYYDNPLGGTLYMALTL